MKRINVAFEDLEFVRLEGVAKVRHFSYTGTMVKQWVLERLAVEEKELEKQKQYFDGAQQLDAFRGSGGERVKRKR